MYSTFQGITLVDCNVDMGFFLIKSCIPRQLPHGIHLQAFLRV